IALLLASRLPVGENPLLLSAVPWFLGALGAAWFASPIDQPERLQGQVLMVAAAAAVILAAVPAGPVTASLAGAMALMPIAGEHWRLPGPLQLPVSLTMLGLAAVAVVVAGLGTSIARIVLFDVSVDVSGAILLASAVLLVAGAALTPIGSEWTALLGVLVVSASAPSLRWAALGALIAVATVQAKEGEHLAWIAFGVLGLTPVLQGVATSTSTSTARVQAVALALGLVLIVLASRVGVIRVLVLPTAGFLVMLALTTVTSPNLVRLQWIAAIGAVLLVSRMVLAWLIDRSGRPAIVRDQLLFALLLLGISARDALGLGALAAALLLIDLAIVRVEVMPERWSGTAARLVLLARSNWPPAVTFAGASMAVIAALQASLALGVLAALLLAGLQLAPLGPLRYVAWAAAAKAHAVARRTPGAIVVAADTEVVRKRRIYGKPGDRRQAAAFLRSLSGRRHQVYTAVHVIDRRSGCEAHGISRTDVTMRELSSRVIAAYVRTGEAQDKAGAYAIQGEGQRL